MAVSRCLTVLLTMLVIDAHSCARLAAQIPRAAGNGSPPHAITPAKPLGPEQGVRPNESISELQLVPLPPLAAPPVANVARPETIGKPAPNVMIDTMPPGYVLWWDDPVKNPIKAPAQPITLDLDSAVFGALLNSPRARILTEAPIIRRNSIQEAAARFDPQAFLETKFTDTSDPVGNLLTTGGAPRFIDQTWNYSSGLRSTMKTGTQVELAQRFGYQDNNSIFFLPAPQGTSRIVLNMTQPLMNGSGKIYNTSLIVLAELQTGKANDQMQSDLQKLLIDINEAYWDLRLRRSAWLQKYRLQERALLIQADLRGRDNFDVLQNQIVRANAAAAEREAAVIRARASVENTEARLRALLCDPKLAAGSALELIPIEPPQRRLLVTDITELRAQALQCRPEIRAALKEVKAAGVRADVSKNELMPTLNLVLSSYVYGLAGQADIGQAYLNQFAQGRPTYAGGLQFDMPLGRRAANARFQQRQIEIRVATSQLQQAAIEIGTEVEIAMREMITTHREMVSRCVAMRAAEAEVDYLTDRWRLLPGDQQTTGVMLDNLLHAHERLADAEFNFSQAEAGYNLALVELRHTTGTLLQYQQVDMYETVVKGVPMLQFSNAGSALRNGPAAEPNGSAPTGPGSAGAAPASAPQLQRAPDWQEVQAPANSRRK